MKNDTMQVTVNSKAPVKGIDCVIATVNTPAGRCNQIAVDFTKGEGQDYAKVDEAQITVWIQEKTGTRYIWKGTFEEIRHKLCLVPDFPNGWTSWQETHFEVVSHVASSSDREGTLAFQRSQQQGMGGLWELAQELTDEFENLHKGNEWEEGKWLETIWEFLEAKDKEIAG